VTDPDLDLVARARAGDAASLNDLVGELQQLVYNLAIRMLNSPSDAEDMTQEILLKVVTNLGSFRGDSAFRTWVYRVASNHLLTARKRAAEQRLESFEALGERLAENLRAGDAPVDDQVLIGEGKLICTSTMLMCLDRDHRIAFILGEILELPSEQACQILEIEDATYRKRVSRARTRMAEFMGKTCGLVNEQNPCRCGAQVAHGISVGTIDPSCLVWSGLPGERQRARVAELDEIARAVEVFRSHPRYIAPESLVTNVRRRLATGTSDLLS